MSKNQPQIRWLWIAVVLLLASIQLQTWLRPKLPAPVPAQSPTLPESAVGARQTHPGATGSSPAADLVAELSQKYSLELVLADPQFPVRTFHGPITGRPAPQAEKQSFLPIFIAEWNLYPVELIKATRLRRIILCEELAFQGQRRFSIPDFEHDDLYFDVVRGRHSESYVRKCIHHEFFHIIDYRDDGQLYADASWAALLPPETRYGTGGKNVQNDPTVSLLDASIAGFLNKYSMSGVEEDKAEIFANMVVDHDTVAARAETDPIIAEKARRMAELLKTFCPQMDENFWTAAQRLNRRGQ
ncbi:MAG: hypothetical protein HY290_11665 [Planctomycetia bacterium]|nr:hypothetical protein [Planctomycetia bacterium]